MRPFYIIPLAPVLANLFMGHHENIWLDQYGDSEVLFYRRYVDDTFCLFHSERDATLFFNYINNQHPNIRFTMERETDHVLPFLDVLINNTDPHQSVTTVYRKKTFTGLLTSYLSFCPFTYKLGWIKTLIHRTFKINNILDGVPYWLSIIVCHSAKESLHWEPLFLNIFRQQYWQRNVKINELCKIARALNYTTNSKYVTLKMTDVPSKHVWKIKESYYVYTTIYIVAAKKTNLQLISLKKKLFRQSTVYIFLSIKKKDT